MATLADAILGHIARKSYKPVKARTLARQLGVGKSEFGRFRDLLRELLREGRIQLGKDQVIRAVEPHGTVVGIFRRTSGGFGFVRPHPTEALAGQEIFVRKQATHDAATGDEVLVKLTRRPSRGNQGLEGHIVRVIERASRQFVGTYFEEGGEGFVRVDGSAFAEPVFVGDPGAKGVRPKDKVVFEMLRFPTAFERGEGVLTEVLGPRGKPGVDILSIIRAFDIPDRFPADALEEARHQAARFDEQDLSGREDWTGEPTITIDPIDARDFDDAVSLSCGGRLRHWTLAVHVADVAHFVPTGGPLDREARRRGNSVYLPGHVIPMFPEIISNGVASLHQGKVRYVKSVVLEFTPQGQRVAVRFANAAIRVTQRFTYERVSEILADPDAYVRQTPPEILDMLLQMRDFSQILRQRRHKRGALELVMPETELEYDEQGRVCGAHFTPHDQSHQIIEEFMLAANEAVAEHLSELGVPFLRRVHAAPDPRKLKDFIDFARSLGYDASPKRAADRFQLQRILDESADKPEVHAIHYALLRSLKQAGYHPAAEGHYALASTDYCHFTSPIRRYPDLTVHRLLGQWLRHGKAGSDPAELIALGEHCSRTERRAEAAERELIKIKLLDYMAQRVGVELTVIITGVHDYGFFGQAESMPVEGLLHVRHLTDDSYYYDGATHSLIGRRTRRRFRLGDKLRVRVARVDTERRELDFEPVELLAVPKHRGSNK